MSGLRLQTFSPPRANIYNDPRDGTHKYNSLHNRLFFNAIFFPLCVWNKVQDSLSSRECDADDSVSDFMKPCLSWFILYRGLDFY